MSDEPINEVEFQKFCEAFAKGHAKFFEQYGGYTPEWLASAEGRKALLARYLDPKTRFLFPECFPEN